MKRPPIYLLLTFWGEMFCQHVSRFVLPSLAAEGNAPHLKDRPDCRLIVCTTDDDWRRLQAEPIFSILSQSIKIEHIPLIENPAEISSIHKYVLMSRGHAYLAQRCFADRAIGMFIASDSIFPAGTVSGAERLYDRGHHVLICAAIRFEMDGIERELAGRLAKGKVLTVQKREAVAMGMRNLHSESRASLWGARNFGRLHPGHGRKYFVTCCMWEVPEDGGVHIITHNWAPMFVDYGMLADHDVSWLDGRAIDGPYIFKNFGGPESKTKIHVVDDSDDMFLLGLTPKAEMEPPQSGGWWLRIPVLWRWTCGYILNRTIFDPTIEEYRRRIYKIPAQWHARDLDEVWRAARVRVVADIEKYAVRDLGVSDAENMPRFFESPLAWLEARWRKYVHNDLL